MKFDYSIFRDISSLLHGNFLVVTLSLCWITFWRGIFNPYIGIYFIEGLEGTYFLLGSLLAFGRLSLALGGIPGGYFCDHYGRRKMMVVGGHITTLTSFIAALTFDLNLFFVGYVSFYLSLFWAPAEQAVLMDSIPPQKRGLGFALNITITGIALMISNYVGGWIYTYYGVPGMRIVLMAMAIAQLIKGVAYTIFLKESLRTKIGEHEKHDFLSAFKLIPRSLKAISYTLKWMPKPLLGFLVSILLFSLGASLTGTQLLSSGQQIIGSFIVLYATVDVISLSIIQWGVIVALMGGINVALTIPIGRLTDKYGRRMPIVIFLVMMSILIPAFVLSQTYYHVMAVMVAIGIAGSLATPAWNSILVDYTPPHMRGQVQSVLQILTATSAFVGSMLGGYLYGIDFTLPFWIYSLLSLSAAFVAILTIKEA